MNYQGKKFLSLPEQVEVNKKNIEQLKKGRVSYVHDAISDRELDVSTTGIN